MKTIARTGMWVVLLTILFRCQENDLVAPGETSPLSSSAITTTLPEYALGGTYYVSTTGNDAGDGSSANPWKTLRYAVTRVQPGQGNTIQVGAGTYIESGLIEVPLGVNVEGAGKDVTFIKAASSFYYNPANPAYAIDKFLISLNQFNPSAGNQSLRNFTIDGDGKQLHGGIYVKYRNNVIIEGVKVQNTNFTGIWLWDVKDSMIKDVHLINCSWGSTAYCVGALNLGNLERVEINNLDVNESTGYGIKAIGPSGYNNIFNLRIHDSRVSVHPYGLWNNGSAPNIAIELWQVNLVACEIDNTYVDNTISLVNSNAIPSTGIQTIRVHHNTLDMETRAGGAGYGMELTIHDAEVDHNYFIKGSYGIANWDNPMQNWNIHHNTFYAIQGIYPGEMVRSQWSGLHNVKFYNNTIEFAGDKTANVIGMYGGTSENLDMRNNLIINSNTSYNWYPNQLIHRENGAVLNNLQVTNNLLNNLDLNVGGLVGGVLGILNPILNNSTANPQINATGNKPDPYYLPAAGSPLIDAGVNLGFPFQGSAPDIGALETGGPTNVPPAVSLTNPANNASFATGSSVTLNATASDSDGTVTKVEFFNSTTKLGEAIASPYSFVWSNLPAGSYSLTAKATDNTGVSTTSATVVITVTLANQLPVVNLWSPANNSSFKEGSSVTLRSAASDSDGTITKVEFFNGSIKVGQDLVIPYGYIFKNIPAGQYSFSAKATDNRGAVATSGLVSVTVIPNSLPVVSLTSPSNNSSFAEASTITLGATASDMDGTISKVEFFSGGTKLGEDLSNPYGFVWSNVPSGNYALTAKATDNKNGTSVSNAVNISVGAASFVQLALDASAATMLGAMALGSDAQAGSYFSVPVGQGTNYYIPPSASAAYDFQLPKTDTYTIWVRVKSATVQNQGYYVYDGKGRWLTWLAGIHTSWTWVKITDSSSGAVALFNFTQGANHIQMGWYHDDMKVDQVIVTNDLNYEPI